MGRTGKRPAPRDRCQTSQGVHLKWVKAAAPCGPKGEALVLESFELVPLPAPAPIAEPQPDAELSIAAAALLADIATLATRTTHNTPDVVVTATVPLVEHGACARGVLEPLEPARLN